jgi:adenylylsulfate kinase-like enzyme
LTGIDNPYEAPEAPDVVVDTTACSPQDCAAEVLRDLERRGFLSADGYHFSGAKE